MSSDPWAHVRREGLAVPIVAPERTGAGVLAAIVDSGVNFDHPHLGLPPRGHAVEWIDGALEVRAGAHRDTYGHGTCCAALVHLLAPGAELLAVRVTHDRATTDADRLATGIEVAASEGAAVIVVALGTHTVVRARLDEVVRAALDRGAVVVAADPGTGVLPAGCPGAIGVGHREGIDVGMAAGVVIAEGRARPAPGFSQNFWGASLASARCASALLRWTEATGDRGAALARGFKKALVVL